MIEILIRREILKAAEWIGGSPELLASLRGASKRRLYDALDSLTADRRLLAAVGAWRETWSDDEVLAALREWTARVTADALDQVRQGHGALKPAAKS